MNLLRFICFVFTLSFNSVAFSIEYQTNFYNLSVHNGINSSEVYKVTQDSKGYIWICTNSGVTRFDGYFYENFTEREGLVDNTVFDIYEDKYGRVWFLGSNSLLCYFQNGKIRKYRFNYKIEKIVIDKIGRSKKLRIDNQGNLIYSVFESGTFKIDNKGKVKQIHHGVNSAIFFLDSNLGFPSLFIDYLKQKKKYILFPTYIQTNHKIKKIGSFDLTKAIDCKKVGNGNKGSSILMIDDKLIDSGSGKVIFEADRIYAFYPITMDKIWIGTKSGLKLIKKRNNRYSVVQTYLKDYSISSILKDNEGGVWISTLEDGVFYSGSLAAKQIISSNNKFNQNIYSITEYNNCLYASYKNGWQNLTKPVQYFWNDKLAYTKLANVDNNLITSDNIEVKFIKNRDRIRIPFCMDIEGNENYFLYVSPRIIKYDLNTDRTRTIYDYYTDTFSSRQTRIKTLVIGANDEIYIGNKNGLLKLVNGHFISNIYNSKNLNFKITDLIYHPKWGLVASTSNKGVVIFGKDGKYRILDKAFGLISDNIRTILVTKENYLLVGSNLGLNYVNLKTKKIGLISNNHGLEHGEITCLYEAKNKIYIGSNKGLYEVPKSTISAVLPSLSRAYLKSINIDGKTIKDIPEIVNVEAGSRLIKIQFRTTNFRNLFNKKYQYRLNKSQNWITINSPEILISDPRGKNYGIDIRYMNENHVWSEPLNIINIKINDLIWETAYFWAFLSLILCTLIFFYFKSLQKKREKKLIIQNQMYSLEQRMQSARMNPHFIFNVLNSIHSFLLFNESKKADDYLMKFSQLMRDTLRGTNDNWITLKDEINILNKYCELENLRLKDRFKYIIEAEELDTSLKIPSLIIQPFVENAIIHGIGKINDNMGELIVEFTRNDNHSIKVSIKDNGPIPIKNDDFLSNENTNHALGIINERLKTFNKLFDTKKFGLNFIRKINESDYTTLIIIVPIITDLKNENFNS